MAGRYCLFVVRLSEMDGRCCEFVVLLSEMDGEGVCLSCVLVR